MRGATATQFGIIDGGNAILTAIVIVHGPSRTEAAGGGLMIGNIERETGR
ncbi:hypothetical protein [Rhizobium sp. BK251]|nr:hypothetical protein [Rhizobium sp. BK251]